MAARVYLYECKLNTMMHTHTHTHTNTHTNTHTHTQSHIHTHLHNRTRTHLCKCELALPRADTIVHSEGIRE
jgi:hypothetical protein